MSSTSKNRTDGPSWARRAVRAMRGHVVGALVPAVVLAVVAGSTAGAVTLVVLSGTEVDEPDATATAVDGTLDDAPDASGDDDDAPDTEEAERLSSGTSDATDVVDAADESAEESTDAPDADEPALTFEETVAVHGQPDLAAILTREFPGARWSLNGNRYTGLTWIDGEAAEQEAAAARAAELEARRNDPDVQALVDSFDPRTIWGPEPDYAAILTRRFPGARWSLNGNDPASGLTWHDDGPAPTKAELDAAWADIAREMALEMDPTELERHAGVGEQVYVEGVLRPKGWVGGANDPQPEGSVNAGVDYRYLPHIPNTNNGSPVGTIDILKDPTGGQSSRRRRHRNPQGWRNLRRRFWLRCRGYLHPLIRARARTGAGIPARARARARTRARTRTRTRARAGGRGRAC